VEWYGNGEWPSGTTVHARLDGESFATFPLGVDSNWHRWRCTWNDSGMYFWMDYVDGAEPYFSVPANSLDDWPFNDPGYELAPSSTSRSVAPASGSEAWKVPGRHVGRLVRVF
jgi:beta-glucanase (GH16 family)